MICFECLDPLVLTYLPGKGFGADPIILRFRASSEIVLRLFSRSSIEEVELQLLEHRCYFTLQS